MKDWKSKVNYTRWRGLTLFSDYPPMSALNMQSRRCRQRLFRALRRTDSERKRCETLAEMQMAAALTKVYQERILGTKKQYNPKYIRLVREYWVEKGHSKSKSVRYMVMVSSKQFGNDRALEISISDVENWMYDMRTEGLENATIMSYVWMMKAIYNHAAKKKPEKRILFNPCKGAETFEGAVRQYLLTPNKYEAYHKIALELELAFADYFFGLWETGRRPEEVAQYRFSFLDDSGKYPEIVVPADIAKTEKADRYPISPALYAWIKSRMPTDKDSLIFPSPDGGNWTSDLYQPLVNKIREITKDKEFVLRDTRRGFVTRKIEDEGCDPDHVLVLSGHRTRQILNRYRIMKKDNIARAAGNNVDRKMVVTNSSQAA